MWIGLDWIGLVIGRKHFLKDAHVMLIAIKVVLIKDAHCRVQTPNYDSKYPYGNWKINPAIKIKISTKLSKHT